MVVKKETDVGWKDLNIGSIVTDAGSADQYRTGGWRSQRAVFDLSTCNKCGLCYIFCPDAAIEMAEDGHPAVNLFYCKGCGICAHECPKDVITMIEEEG
ncbi:4Fe-4S binding protein [Chloroflexota bacterium]